MAKSAFNIKMKGAKEFIKAIKKNPSVVATETKKYFVKSRVLIIRQTQRNPWGVGSGGGGVPVDKGNLRQKWERLELFPWKMIIGVDTEKVPYSKYVHGRGFGEVNRRTGVKSRPWLFHAFKKSKPAIMVLQDKLRTNVIKNLAK